MRAALFGLAGLAFGSFLTVVVHRVPRRESAVGGRSRCPRCGAGIRARDNVPLLSYALLRGRCRRCGARISTEYPLTEAATAGLFAGAALRVEPLLAAALVAPFLGLMLAVGIIDARWRIVPNAIVYPAVPAFAAAIAVVDLLDGGVDVRSGLLGLVAYGGPLFLIALAVPRGMGMGDAKLAALIGLVLGSLGLRFVAVAAAAGIVGGGLGAALAMAALGRSRREHIPFGPFLAAGATVSALAGAEIWSAYLSAF